MPADDRDSKFERALAHHLRGDSVSAACPDAETLGAYHERSLSLEEMAHWKQHISGCAACQETLALVEATEKQLTEDWEERKIPVLEAAAQGPSPTRSTAARSKPASGEEALGEETSAAIARPIELSWRGKPPLLRWAVPLGAVAAGVLVWIGVHEQRVLRAPKSAEVQVAQNAPAAAPEQKMSDALRTAQPPMERDDRQGRFNEKGTRERAESSNLEPRRMSPSVPAATPERNANDAELAKRESAGRTADSLAYQTVPAPPPPQALGQEQPKAPSSARENVEVSAGAPSVKPAPVPAARGGIVGGAVAEADTKSPAPEKKEKALNKQQAVNDLDTSAMMMKQGVNGRNVTSMTALVQPQALILTPDNRVWWRIDPTGTLELTNDSGKTWRSVDAGAVRQLTAGSAPSSKICWIAGKAGTLVLTTDRGAHWKALKTPITGDLGGVRATDAKHASIWDAARQQSFETSDGGATWTQTAP